MTYTEALERAKHTPVMRPHWKNYWLTYEDGKHFQLNYSGLLEPWRYLEWERDATDWIEALKNKSVTDPD